MFRRFIFALILVCMVVGFANAERPAYKSDELIVVFKDVGAKSKVNKFFHGPVSSDYVKSTITDIVIPGSKIKENFGKSTRDMARVSLPKRQNVIQAMARFRDSENIEYVQPNFYYYNYAVPNDASYSSQWSLNNRGQSGGTPGADISAEEGWEYSTGSKTGDVVIAVIDDGVQFVHTDLAGNMWWNPDNDPNDPNADWPEEYLHGIDIAGADVNNANDQDGDPSPGENGGHGTHVAGIVGAKGNNSRGITGVCWDVNIMAIKIFADNSQGALTSDEVKGIDWAVDHNAHVINASWGGYNFDTALRSSIKNAGDHNVVFVAAAGNGFPNNSGIPNDNDGLDPAYPASYNLDNIISVMATNHDDNRASYSNFGATTVDIAAPGGDDPNAAKILSTYPDNTFARLSGTSMAAPHVAGAVGLMLAIDPNLSVSQIKGLVVHPMLVDQLPDLQGRCVSGGRLNLEKLLRAANSVNATGNRVKNLEDNAFFSTIQAAIDDAGTGDGETLYVQNDNWYFEDVNFAGKNLIIQSVDDLNTPDLNFVHPNNTFISTYFDANDNPVVRFISGESTAARLTGFSISDANDQGTHVAGIDIIDSNANIQECIISFNYSSGVSAVNCPSLVLESSTISDNEGVNGGGIYILDSVIDFNNTSITDNVATDDGGGIFSEGSLIGDVNNCSIIDNDANNGGGFYKTGTGDPNLIDTVVQGNMALESGGGLYLDVDTIMMLEGCDFHQNSASDFGGGLYLDANSTADINDTIFTTNSSTDSGGGIYSKTSNGYFNQLTLTSNSSQYNGGGIYFDGAAVDVNQCTFISNFSNNWGGGICYKDVEDANVFDTEFHTNTAQANGGGIFIDGENLSPITILNCLFNGNKATTYYGGALVCLASDAVITNCTFANNVSNINNPVQSRAGAIMAASGSSPVITNCIFSGNNYIAIYEFDSLSDPILANNLFFENTGGDYYDNATGLYSADINDANFTDINTLAEVSNSIYGDPKFVQGALGNFYLAHDMNDPNLQPYTGQSPAVDAGTGTSAALIGAGYHTRTDNVEDTGDIDLGYHYNDPDAAVDYTITLVFTPNAASASTTVTTDPNNTAVTTTVTRKQFAEIVLTVTPTEYDLTGWQGTIDDANLGYDDSSGTYTNVVLADNSKNVEMTFKLVMIELRFLVWTGGSEPVAVMTPETGFGFEARRGTKVPLHAEPYNPSHAIIWHNTDDDSLITQDNTKTLLDPDGDGRETVYVQMYSPQIWYVANDMNYPLIQMTIDDANPRDIIEITPGTYDIHDSSQDHPRIEVNKVVTVKSSDPTDPCVVAATILIGGFQINGVGRNMVIDGLTIRGNYANGDGCDGDTDCNPHEDGANGAPHTGGGIRLNNASPTIRNTVFDRCSSTAGDGGNGGTGGDGGWGGWSWGGGIYVDTFGSPLLERCSFIECSVNPGSGGNGDLSADSPGHGGTWGIPTDSRWFYGPYQPYYRYSGYGGAVFCDSGSTPEFVDCSFIGNRANGSVSGRSGPVAGWPEQHFRIPRFGGAVYVAANSKPTFTDCYFADNIADNNSPAISSISKYPSDSGPVNSTPYVSYGGAVAMESSAAPFFENCTFEENIADIGGAINWDDSDPCLDSSSFISNVALIGGAVHCVEGAGIITRCHFMLNDANGTIARGGAIANYGANTAIRDSQFMSNTSTGSGGAIFVSNKDLDGVDFTGVRQTMIKNCLIVGNSSEKDGGGIAAAGFAEPNIINCTIVNNTATGQGVTDSYGGGVSALENSYVRIINSIIWDNDANNGTQLAIRGDSGHPSEMKVSYSNILGGAAGVHVQTGSVLDWDYESNFDGVEPTDNPQFVLSEGFYLSQDPCQATTSPCVDAGSDTAFNLGLYRHTTNTNLQIDGYGDMNDMVDLGYHYITYANLEGDLDYDGDVDFDDYIILAVNYWLADDCIYPDWCSGTDLNEDGKVDWLDQAILSGIFGSDDPNHAAAANDTTPPMPNPMTWASAPEPNAADPTTSVIMTATTAVDLSGQAVEYLFQMFDENGVAIAGVDANSGWVDDPFYSFDNLSSNMTYRFRVKARDAKGNETAWSSEGPASTSESGTSADDHLAPAWSASAWQVQPYAVDPCAPGSIYMKANSAYDQSGVEYMFICYDDSNEVVQEYNSNWQSSREYQLFSVFGGTYTFEVIARDLSVNQNTTISERSNSVTITGDSSAPVPVSPILSYSVLDTGTRLYLTLTATEPTDENTPISYMFRSSSSYYNQFPGMNQWSTSNTLQLNMGIGISTSTWFVKFRDSVGNETEFLPLNGIIVPSQHVN